MKIIPICILLLVINLTYSFSQQIDFRQFNSINDVVTSIQDESKPAYIFLHYQGCGWCRKMEKTVFIDKKVADYYNNSYIPISLDINKDELGKYFKEKYSLMAYPANLYINHNGELSHKTSGFNTSEEFIYNGKIAMDSTQNMYSYQKLIDQGRISAETLTKFFEYYPEYPKKDSLITAFIDNSKENKYSVESWELISSNARRYDSKYFKFIVDNEDNYRKHVDNSVIDEFLISHWVFMINLWKFRDNPNESKRTKMKEELTQTEHPLVQRVISQADYELVIEQYVLKPSNKNRWNDLIISSKQYITNSYNDWQNYNKTAWTIFENYKNFEKQAESLQLGITLSELSLGFHKDFDNLDTYARLLRETGQTDKAIEIIEEALILANHNSNTYGINTAKTLLKDWKH